MANAREIKRHINSVRDTAKITNAMYLISSTKMQKARRHLEESRPYFDAVRNEVSLIFKYAEKADSRYFFKEYDGKDAPGRHLGAHHDGHGSKKDDMPAILVITADKGLCGNYNLNVLRETEKVIERFKGARLFVIGEYGRHYFERRGIAYEASFEYMSQTPTMEEARDITDRLLELYDNEEVSRVYCMYTIMRSAITSEPCMTRMLPFERSEFTSVTETVSRKASIKTMLFNKEEAKKRQDYEFVPSAGAVLDNALRSLSAGFIYNCLVSSFCSEQDARMMAMDSANDNAKALLENLGLEYNRARQAAVTNEITEISAGELAQKRKRLRKAAKDREI